MMPRRLLLLVAVLLQLAAPAGAQTLRVLVTNDYGIGAPGINALVNKLLLNPNLQVDVVAPATNQSGTTDDFTTAPFGVAAGTTSGGVPGKKVSGTPADSVMWA